MIDNASKIFLVIVYVLGSLTIDGFLRLNNDGMGGSAKWLAFLFGLV